MEIGIIWQTGARLLVAQGESRFVLVDASGAVADRFESGTFSDEDDLWRWEHVVVAERFYKRTTIERYSGTDQHQEELLLDGLRPTDDPETRGFVTAALANDRVARAAAVSRAEREADARIAALGVPLDDHDLGVDLARAQTALIHRVRAYDDALAAALLRTLVIVVRARPGPAVIAAYARACLFACFDHRAAAVPLPSVVDDDDLDIPGPLADALAARARDLEAAADGQERADALNNARAYSQAAHAALVASLGLIRSRRHLRKGGYDGEYEKRGQAAGAAAVHAGVQGRRGQAGSGGREEHRAGGSRPRPGELGAVGLGQTSAS